MTITPRKKEKTPQELLDILGYNQYVEKNIVNEMPEDNDEGIVEYFNLNRYVTDDELEKEYESRGLVAANPRHLIGILTNEKDLIAEKGYIATHWKDKYGKWCFASFPHWHDGERNVYVDRSDYGWFDYSWFAGVRKSLELDNQPSLETLSFEPMKLFNDLEGHDEVAINYLKSKGYKMSKDY